MHNLQALGFEVIRSAGSHGPVDLLASNEKEAYAIQVKYCCKAGPKDRQALSNYKFPACAKLRRQIWEFEKGNKQAKITDIKEGQK